MQFHVSERDETQNETEDTESHIFCLCTPKLTSKKFEVYLIPKQEVKSKSTPRRVRTIAFWRLRPVKTAISTLMRLIALQCPFKKSSILDDKFLQSHF